MKYIERGKDKMTLERDIWAFLWRKTSGELCEIMCQKLEDKIKEELAFKQSIS